MESGNTLTEDGDREIGSRQKGISLGIKINLRLVRCDYVTSVKFETRFKLSSEK